MTASQSSWHARLIRSGSVLQGNRRRVASPGAAFLFLKRMAEVTNVTLVSRELQDSGPSLDHSGAIYRRNIPGRGGV